MKQKLLALASALALCLSLAGCHISTPATVGAIGGQEISSGLYLLAQFDAKPLTRPARRVYTEGAIRSKNSKGAYRT